MYFFKCIFPFDSIPWDVLVSCLPEERPGRGTLSWFGSKGMFALMFLKAYLNTSDRQLLERYNTDWALQYFCGKVLSENQQFRLCSPLGVKRPRSKLREQRFAHMAYSRKRKNSFRKTLRKKSTRISTRQRDRLTQADPR